MTETEQVTKDGKPGIKITCDCATHGASRSAIIVGATATALAARKGRDRDERIHGFVTLANHPAKMMQVANERNGIFAA
jgi:hypothetical protein